MARIWKFIEDVDVTEIEFVLEGAEMNKAISDEGLRSAYGLQIGRTLTAPAKNRNTQQLLPQAISP